MNAQDLGLGDNLNDLCQLAMEFHDTSDKMSQRYFSESRKLVDITPAHYHDLIKIAISQLKKERKAVCDKIKSDKVSIGKF